MITMKKEEIINAALQINEYIKNKDNWRIDRDKSYIIKLRGIKELMACKISHLSTMGDEVFLSLAVLRRKFSFRAMRFIPYIMIMNVPIYDVEYIINPFPETINEITKEDEKKEEDNMIYM